jgi:hypothetical protein
MCTIASALVSPIDDDKPIEMRFNPIRFDRAHAT